MDLLWAVESWSDVEVLFRWYPGQVVLVAMLAALAVLLPVGLLSVLWPDLRDWWHDRNAEVNGLLADEEPVFEPGVAKVGAE